MRSDGSPSFSRLVCGAEPVRSAFAVHRPTRFWWNLILWLHGKPNPSSLSESERVKRIADGFTFYASLYRFLGALFFLIAPLFALLPIVAGDGRASFYWAGASLLAGIYLWCVSGLGYAGARSYAQGQRDGISLLIAFLVMIVAFLSLFVAAVSVVAHDSAWLDSVLNLAATAGLFVFGVGSYMIEILYLATERLS